MTSNSSKINYKDSLRTLRPKEYTRNMKNTFEHNSISYLESKDFKSIDMLATLNRFEK